MWTAIVYTASLTRTAHPPSLTTSLHTYKWRVGDILFTVFCIRIATSRALLDTKHTHTHTHTWKENYGRSSLLNIRMCVLNSHFIMPGGFNERVQQCRSNPSVRLVLKRMQFGEVLVRTHLSLAQRRCMRRSNNFSYPILYISYSV